MKTKLFSLLVCALLSVSLYAQENDLQQNKKRSFLINASAGVSKDFDISMSLRGMYSYSYNTFFSLGVGTGIFYNNNVITKISGYIQTEEHDYKDFSLEIPLFVNIKGNLISEKFAIRPYYSLSLGYILPLKKANYEYAEHYLPGSSNHYNLFRITEFYQGVFIAPELGVSSGRFAIGAEFIPNLTKNRNIVTESYSYSNNNEYFKSEPKSEYETFYIINVKLTYIL